MKICTAENCAKKHHAKGYCSTHLTRLQRYGTLHLPPKKDKVPCNAPNCQQLASSNYCPYHLKRLWKGRPLEPNIHPRTCEIGDTRITSNGYVKVKIAPGTWEFEHRLVMEKYLHRPLYSFETVHHKNGVRTDNALDNLELWTTYQPSGQRVEDLLNFVISNYTTELKQKLP